MRLSPRERRLNADYLAMQKLCAGSSIFDFESRGNPPDRYRVVFKGPGIWRPDNSGSAEFPRVEVLDRHEVLITLTAAYPRMIPELAWQTPVFHPNISASGVVCLGGYGTHWVPSLMLDELCNMLWDMIRFKNFDIESPYNRDAASWARHQTLFQFPLDERPLRDLVVGEDSSIQVSGSGTKPPIQTQADVTFVEAEIVEECPPPAADEHGIMFIE